MGSPTEPRSNSWLSRFWQSFTLIGEAAEMSDAERLERRFASLEANAAKLRDLTTQMAMVHPASVRQKRHPGRRLQFFGAR